MLADPLGYTWIHPTYVIPIPTHAFFPRGHIDGILGCKGGLYKQPEEDIVEEAYKTFLKAQVRYARNICFLDFVIKYLRYRNWDKAYRNIIFEREAYANQSNLDYLKVRGIWWFTAYFKNNSQ